jgi:ACS family hexuronate transporter-like MFS transporter
MLLVSLVSYIDRNTLALLAPTILEQTRLTAEQYGYAISAFSIAYTIANPLWGRWLDRVGVRWGMVLAVALWTAASASHALAVGLLSFAAARAALGFGEGATFPGGLRTAVETLPPEKQSRGIAVAYSGGSLGAIVTPLVITPIAHYWGWRAAFLFTGGAGAAWMVLWHFVSGGGALRPGGAAAKSGPVPGLQIFRDPRIWSYMCAYAWGALPLALILYGASLFLSRSLGMTQVGIGAVLWIPPLGWEIGYFTWGWLADRRVAAGRHPTSAFQPLLAAAMLASLPLALTPWVRPLWAVMALMFVSTFAAGGFIILTVGWTTRVYASEDSGLVAGLGAGAWSLMVAVIMPVFGRLFDRGRFDIGFALAAAFPVLGFGTWWLVNRRPAAPSRSSPVAGRSSEG